MSRAPRQAAVLAGGLGTRLRSVVSDRPKTLADVQGRPFLLWLLDDLVAQGVSRIVLCTGHLADQVADLVGDRHGDTTVVHSVETEPLGTAGALRHALPHLEGPNTVVVNGDTWCAADLTALQRRHQAAAALATITCVEVPDGSRYGRVDSDATGAVTGFVEKPSSTEPAWINAGIAVVECDVIAMLPRSRAVSLEREVLPSLIGRGLFAYRAEGAPFVDIGTPESYASVAGGLPQRITA